MFPTRKVPFRNPLRQNRRHVEAVEAALAGLPLPAGSVRSVVALVGKAQLKSVLPPNVTTGEGWARYIASFRQPILSDHQVHEIAARSRRTAYRRRCRRTRTLFAISRSTDDPRSVGSTAAPAERRPEPPCAPRPRPTARA